MDIDAACNSSWHNNKGKGKGKKGHQKGKGKYQGKGYNSSYNNKGDIPSATGTHFNKEIHSKEHQKGKERIHRTSTRKEKENQKGTDTCYKCGQQAHIAKNCRVAVYNADNNEHQQWENDPTYDWYQDQWQQEYDQGWYNQDWPQQGYDQGHQQQASSQSPPPASTTSPGMAQSISAMEDIYQSNNFVHQPDWTTTSSI